MRRNIRTQEQMYPGKWSNSLSFKNDLCRCFLCTHQVFLISSFQIKFKTDTCFYVVTQKAKQDKTLTCSTKLTGGSWTERKVTAQKKSSGVLFQGEGAYRFTNLTGRKEAQQWKYVWRRALPRWKATQQQAETFVWLSVDHTDVSCSTFIGRTKSSVLHENGMREQSDILPGAEGVRGLCLWRSWACPALHLGGLAAPQRDLTWIGPWTRNQLPAQERRGASGRSQTMSA